MSEDKICEELFQDERNKEELLRMKVRAGITDIYVLGEEIIDGRKKYLAEFIIEGEYNRLVSKREITKKQLTKIASILRGENDT